MQSHFDPNLELIFVIVACSQYILMRAPPNLTVNTTILVDLVSTG